MHVMILQPLLPQLPTIKVKKGTIGRDVDQVDVPIPDVLEKHPCMVSRRHLLIEDDKVTDLNTTNGTRVNGIKINARILKSGDIVTLGSAKSAYQWKVEVLPSEDDMAVAKPTETQVFPESMESVPESMRSVEPSLCDSSMEREGVIHVNADLQTPLPEGQMLPESPDPCDVLKKNSRTWEGAFGWDSSSEPESGTESPVRPKRRRVQRRARLVDSD